MTTTDPSNPSMHGPYVHCVKEAAVKIEEAAEVAKDLEGAVASSTAEDPRFSDEVTALRKRIDDLLTGAMHLLGG
jgi:hypothetical protein